MAFAATETMATPFKAGPRSVCAIYATWLYSTNRFETSQILYLVSCSINVFSEGILDDVVM